MFPENASSFYAARDDRTSRCTTSRRYQQLSCLVTAEESELESSAGRLMLLVGTNLLSRWCREVTVVLRDGADALRAQVLAQMRDADPFGSFTVAKSPRASDVRLHIGRTPAKSAVSIFASGWIAGVNTSSPRNMALDRAPTVGVGAIAAACLGVAEIFKQAVEVQEGRHMNGVFDMFRLERVDSGLGPIGAPSQGDHDFGDALLVGAGSVGSAFAYCASLLGLRGRLTVVDFDTVKVENLNRSPVFGVSSIGRKKANVVVDFLDGGPIAACAVPTSWSEFITRVGRRSAPPDLWIPVANEEDVRRSIQNNIPPIMIEAATSENWGVNFGRHAPGRDDCLTCRFPPHAVREEHLQCSTAELAIAGERVDAALPFLSVLAGLLVAAEVLRLQMKPHPAVPNFASFDLGSGLQEVQRWDRACQPCCTSRIIQPALLAFPPSRYCL